MLASVDLNYDTCFATREVNDVLADGDLAAKPLSCNLIATQSHPETFFSIRHRGSKPAGAFNIRAGRRVHRTLLYGKPPPFPPPQAGEGKVGAPTLPSPASGGGKSRRPHPALPRKRGRDNAPVTRFYEDFHVGDVIDVGSVTVGEADIIAFARQYDPQPMHTDPRAAEFTIYGGLIASGWHTVALFMRLLVENLVAKTSSLGSPGVEELRWPLPVRPGDTLHGSMEILETRASNSRPSMGIVRWRGTVRNQDGKLVMTLIGTNFFGRRPS